MRPIKFRGRIVNDHVEKWKRGEIVYGSLMIFADDPIDGCTHWIIDENSKPYRNYPVEPDSVAQLIGLDANGREVYEGDNVIIDGKEYVGCLLRACPRVEFGTLKGAVTNA